MLELRTQFNKLGKYAIGNSYVVAWHCLISYYGSSSSSSGAKASSAYGVGNGDGAGGDADGDNNGGDVDGVGDVDNDGGDADGVCDGDNDGGDANGVCDGDNDGVDADGSSVVDGDNDGDWDWEGAAEGDIKSPITALAASSGGGAELVTFPRLLKSNHNKQPLSVCLNWNWINLILDQPVNLHDHHTCSKTHIWN